MGSDQIRFVLKPDPARHQVNHGWYSPVHATSWHREAQRGAQRGKPKKGERRESRKRMSLCRGLEQGGEAEHVTGLTQGRRKEEGGRRKEEEEEEEEDWEKEEEIQRIGRHKKKPTKGRGRSKGLKRKTEHLHKRGRKRRSCML
jgi:hypothetical protein